jgi:hypothetical protein
MYHLMGVDPHHEVRDQSNRPVPLSYGNVVDGVIA